VDVAGPALDVPAAALAASLYCPSSIANATQPVILLVPGTDTIPSVDYDWDYELAFTENHMPWCAVTLPYSATGDIQTAGEYLVNAIRTMYATSGRKLHVLGWSQGGMVPRWALRFWPDTRNMIDDLVSLDASNHGTIDSELSNSQAPADWQQAANAHFIAALNSYTETFAGINYTQIFSYDDEIVVPNSAVDSSSSLSVGPGKIANVAVQQICPNDTSDHLAMGTYDAVGYALAIDAFAKGIAATADIPLTVCAETYQPAVVPAQFPANYSAFLQYTTSDENHAPSTSAEPTAAPYVYTQ
jgi:triacylglycerol esterase/lipase EstA (alpha/beta hydrolase family)